METQISTLVTTWYFILGLLAAVALALEGTSLGVGALSLLLKERRQREDLMGSIGPVWHANVTWLVVAGGVLFGAFPLFYGMLLSTLYIPVILLLVGVIFRSVALELYEGTMSKARWARTFGLGSLGAALGLAFILGGALAGLQGGGFSGGDLRWLTPLSVAIAGIVLLLALLLGSLFLVDRTENETQAFARLWAARLFPALLVYGGLTGAWLLSCQPFLNDRWLDWPGMLFTLLPFLLFLWVYASAWIRLRRKQEGLFLRGLACSFLFGLAFGASLYPWLVPGALQAGQAAGQDLTLKIFLRLTGPLLPVLAIYNIYLYRIFRGKVGRDGYGLYEQ